ncbi:hypothetical protein KEJ45_03445 [Candidatus Bathyarchaeota archaeon]|nr:hypothetical protein [Candidatus Bathyarchaeota archaeon]
MVKNKVETEIIAAKIPKQLYRIMEKRLGSFMSLSDYLRNLIRRDLENHGLLEVEA